MSEVKSKPWVYVSGPYSGGDVVLNVRAAIKAGKRLRGCGCVQIVPHTSMLAHLIEPEDYEYWLSLDLDLIEGCDAVLRLPGDSPGGDREVARAEALGLPVFGGTSGLNDCSAWAIRWLAERLAEVSR